MAYLGIKKRQIIKIDNDSDILPITIMAAQLRIDNPEQWLRETDKHFLNKKLSESKISTIKKKCPKCGNRLIKRNGKYGIFLGCHNYPKCKYTTNY